MTDAQVEAAARVLTAIYVDKTYFGNDAFVREQLIEISRGLWVSAARAALAAADGAAWQPIETALRDRMILVYAPPFDGLPEIVGQCRWHEDAGFCVDELRFPTHWRLMPAPPTAISMESMK